MSWSCYMQDLAELIENRLLLVDDTTNHSVLDLTKHNEPAGVSLSASTLEALLELDLQFENGLQETDGLDKTCENTEPGSILTSLMFDSFEDRISEKSSTLGSSSPSKPDVANTSPPTMILQTTEPSSANMSPAKTSSSTGNWCETEMTTRSSPVAPSRELVKSSITPETTERPVNTPMTSMNSPTSLQTRTVEMVIQDLQDLRALPQDDHPKRRKLNAANVAGVNSTTESTSNDYLSSDSEGEPDDKPVRPLKITERKRVMNATIDDYVRQRNIEEVRKGSYVRPEDENKQSTRWLVNQSENRQIISTPREYQIELFERAKERNIIAVLDTGAGKTLIAVLLLRHIFAQELEDRAVGKAPRISFFLVDSVNLVFQQHAVLKANLDQPMNMFCGDMGCDLWNKEQWDKHFRENMVIVCTAEVLRQCLHHSFISIEQINILIFDEAHHAKKDHAYARIIKDFYAQASPACLRPKIFGMTASPVDARVDVRRAALELEGLLHSQICTIDDPELAKYTVSPTQELIARYSPLGPIAPTPLFSQMRELLGMNKIIARPLAFALDASRSLGSWCADQVWLYCLGDDEFEKLSAKTERNYHKGRSHGSLARLEQLKMKLQEARDVVKAHKFEEPDFNVTEARGPHYTSKNISSKVVVLVQYLKERFERPTDDRCIIFVKQRYTARILEALLSHPKIGTPYLSVGSLVGTRTGEAGDLNISFREQIITMLRFRKGALNCLIATSVAEEGLDIPDCNLVIRFDLYDTVIQYIQSRGRARHANSRYVHMIERGNQLHENSVLQARKDEGILKRFCNLLDDDRKLKGSSFDIDYHLRNERSHRVYTVETTGAKLTYKMSLMVLANFVDSLPCENGANLQPEYMIQSSGRGFECEVILPEGSPVHGAIGKMASSKQVAKCSAAFEACLELIKGKYLDENLLPIFRKQVPVMRNAALAVDSKKREMYSMKVKPKLWSVDTVPNKLFLTIISLGTPECLNRPSQPIGILTRSELVQLPEFILHFGKGKHSAVSSTPLPQPIHVDANLLAQIDTFTLCIFHDVFSKQYESDTSRMPYFIVPIIPSASVQGATPASLIDWKVLELVKDHQTKWAADTWANKSWQEECDDFFNDKFIVDPYDGGRKLFLVGSAPQYKPLDPVPPNTAPRKGTRKNNSNIMEYSISLWAKSRSARTFDENQRVFEAQLVSLRRNLLDEFEEDEEAAPTKCFIVLQAMKISCLPSSVVSMVLTFPAIIHRIESYLIALEATELIHISVRPDLALEACTKDSDNSGEHDADQINFQRGMGKNYERLEFIGDCFLKMATSISLYGLFPGNDEYKSHVDRMCLLCNANLCTNAVELKLYEYIRSMGFNRRAWYPEGLVLLSGKGALPPNSHALGDKSIADVSEALIGAALVTHHPTKNMDDAVRAVTELVCSENHNVKVWADYYKLYEKPKYQLAESTAAQRDMAAQMEKKHSYHFNYPRLLRSAFTHPSYSSLNEQIPSYQRLEFLGDALLDMACVNFLFYNYPTKDPQWLTEHKMAMVSNQFLGALCVHLGFHVHLLTMNTTYARQIKDYVEEIQEARLQVEKEALELGKPACECSPDYWTFVRQPPKSLPDIVEAYIGAIFVDSEYNFEEVERFFDDHIRWFFKDMTVYDTYANKQPTTFLSNFLQINMGCMDWGVQTRELIPIDGSKPQQLAAVVLHGKVIADYTTESSRYAKVGVAKKALELLKGLPITEFRQQYGCDCREVAEDTLDENTKMLLHEIHGTGI